MMAAAMLRLNPGVAVNHMSKARRTPNVSIAIRSRAAPRIQNVRRELGDVSCAIASSV
jgi:hypothetical protein